jgi:alpha-L-fucosidase
VWAHIAKQAGFRYICLTTRHHDGYCLWDSRYTDYTSAQQAPKRDFVKEYVKACRAVGLRVGLYYSWIDWRLPAYMDGPAKDPEGWAKVRTYLHNQVEELLTRYGKIDYFFFDGVWPREADELGSAELLAKMRQWQPDILINNRVGRPKAAAVSADGGEGAGATESLGDFGTPEHRIIAEQRLWESCQVSTWRLWGYATGERWRPADVLLDMLCECAEKGGNLIMNVGPTAEGQFPPEFVERALAIGRWLKVHGEAIYGTKGGDITEFVTRGRQTVKGNNLYLIIRFWDGQPELRLADLVTPVLKAQLLTTGQELPFEQHGDDLFICGLPAERPTALFPVIKLVFAGRPQANQWGRHRLWGGNPERVAAWARRRGTSVWVDGEER